MRLGVFGPWLEPWSAAKATWQHLEGIGFDVAYLGDHLTHPSLKGRWIADAYATLAAVAQVTTRLGARNTGGFDGHPQVVPRWPA